MEAKRCKKRHITCRIQTSALRVGQHIRCVNDVFPYTHVDEDKVKHSRRRGQPQLLCMDWSEKVDICELWRIIVQTGPSIRSSFQPSNVFLVAGQLISLCFQSNYAVSDFLALHPIFLIRLIKSGCKPAINLHLSSATRHTHTGTLSNLIYPRLSRASLLLMYSKYNYRRRMADPCGKLI